MTEVSIVQPYVPNYRVPFFRALKADLARSSITLRIIAGRVSGEQALRGDAADEPWLEEVDSHALRLGSRTLALTSSAHLWRKSDAVIVPHQGSSLDAITAFVGRRPKRVGVWGHIGSYTSPLNPIDGLIERWQLRSARHVFAYTPSGADVAISAGVPASRITTVMNTIDTAALEAALASVTPQSLREFEASHAIPERPYFTSIGGLDRSKQVDLLADALEVLHARNIDVHIVIAGRGKDEELLGAAADRGQCTLIGYADDSIKAHLLSGAKAIVNPGRVGLIAVDVLAAKKPLLTTEPAWHAPELEYIDRPGILHRSANDAQAFAGLIQRLDEDNSLMDPGVGWPEPPRLETMVRNFARGIRSLLA